MADTLDHERHSRLEAFAEAVAASGSDTAGTRAMARYALTGSLAGVLDEMRGAAAGFTPDGPKPDGWHTYHVCGGVLRELTAVGAVNGPKVLICMVCSETYDGRVGALGEPSPLTQLTEALRRATAAYHEVSRDGPDHDHAPDWTTCKAPVCTSTRKMLDL